MAHRPDQIVKGTVASRVTVFEDYHGNPRPASSLPLRTPLLNRQSERSNFDKRRRATSCATTRMRQDSPHRTKTASLQPVLIEVPSDMICPPNEEKELYQCPFPTPVSTEPNSGGQTEMSSRDEASNDESLHLGLQSAHLLMDGTAELAAIRTRLRSIVASKETVKQEPVQDKTMLKELDSLLQDAIQEQTGSSQTSDDTGGVRVPARSNSARSSKAVLLQQSSNLHSPPSSLRLPHSHKQNQSLDNHTSLSDANRGEQALRIDKCIGNKDRSHLPQTLARSVSHRSAMSSSSKTVPPQDKHQIANRQADGCQKILEDTHDLDTEKAPRARRASLAFPRQYASPVKQRAALYETMNDLPSRSVHANDGRQFDHRPGLFRTKSSNQHRFDSTQPATQIPVAASGSGGEAHPSLLVLPISVPGKISTMSSSERHSGNSKNDYSTAQESLNSPTSEFSSNAKIGGRERERAELSDRTVQHTEIVCSDPFLFEPQPGTTGSRSPEQHVAHTVKRPSIVQGKINELMAASNQNRGHKQKHRQAHANVPPTQDGPVHKTLADSVVEDQQLPTLQVPVKNQAAYSSADPVKSLPATPHKTRFPEEQILDAESLSEHTASPVKSTLGTPQRGRPTKLKNSVTSHGSPYSVEQRFTLSPTRRTSPGCRGLVRVSVEVRNSPVRELSTLDDRLLIVRASVEPDDSDSDSDVVASPSSLE